MPKLRVHNFSMSLDGYAAGLGQNVDNLDSSDRGYECVEFVGSSAVAHARLSRKTTT
jgi:hypothetical protein